MNKIENYHPSIHKFVAWCKKLNLRACEASSIIAYKNAGECENG